MTDRNRAPTPPRDARRPDDPRVVLARGPTETMPDPLPATAPPLRDVPAPMTG